MFRAPTSLPILLAAALLAGAPARADDWTDARAEFRTGTSSEAWKERRDAFFYLAGHDRPEAVTEILGAIRKEDNAAVLLAAVEGLAALGSVDAREALYQVALRGRGRERLLVLVALSEQKGPRVGEVLREVAKGRDAQAAAQAVLGLASERRPDAVPVLLKLVGHEDWQVRAAAARALGAYEEAAAIQPLSRALMKARGRDRADLIAALETISGQEFGNDPAAWKRLADGVEPGEIQAHPELLPTAFGIPMYGQRVVICLDNSLRMTNPHPFDGERLRALCDPQDGEPIPWFRMKTIEQFVHAHVKHVVRGFPKGTKLEVLVFNERISPVFGRLTTLGAGPRATLLETLEGLITDDGIATYPVLQQALDVAGAKDTTAWNAGPDEILFVTVNMPTAGDIREADLVAAAIALRARLRMVTVHTVGIDYHPYELCRELAARTGGIYVDLTK